MNNWKLCYHLMPKTGWMNDPNGLCQFKSHYHIFYQYSPDNIFGKKICWGHYSTKDFIHYIREPIAIYPDSQYDKDGAYSGSAVVYKGKLYLFYTGNIKFEGKYDYINQGRGHFVNRVESADGQCFSKKISLLKNRDYPTSMSCHVRDPKIFLYDNSYYMILGARTVDSKGCALIYKSVDLYHWEYLFKIKNSRFFGYMWECPDILQIENRKFMLLSPQGLVPEYQKYENQYQSGYIPFESIEDMNVDAFVLLDYGFDFYAPQTFTDEEGRKILIAWMGLPDIMYFNPTIEQGWQHALTLPRELFLKNNKIYQYPIKEMEQLRLTHTHCQLKSYKEFALENQVFELHITELNDNFTISMREDTVIQYENNIFTLSFRKSGFGRNKRHLYIEEVFNITVFSDTSSLEIFINDGEYVMTSRVYDSCSCFLLKCTQDCIVDMYLLSSLHIEETV